MIPILRLIGKLVGNRPAPVNPGNPAKILIADLSFIGDIVMTSVTHAAVRRLLPGAAIHVLGLPVVNAILPLLPVDVLHTVPKEGKLKHVAAALRLRRERFDVAIHLNTGLWVNFLVWLTGARLRAGYDYRERGCFNNIRIPIETRTVKTRYRPEECALLLERSFGWAVTERIPVLAVDEETKGRVRGMLREWGVGEGEFLVGIHTSSRQDRETRCWEEAKFAAVANDLIERHGAKIVFTDVAADRPYVEPIMNRIVRKERIVDAMGRTTIPELCALLQRTDLLITINTAPMHLAIALGTPLVAVLGYGPPYLYFPPGDRRFQHVTDPALDKYDPRLLVQTEPSRIKEIPVRDVLEKVEYLISHVVPRTSGKAAGGAQEM